MARNEFIEFQNRIKHLFIEHSEITRIWKRMDKNRLNMKESMESDESPIHLFIEGKPGSGKSVLTKKYVKRIPGYTRIDKDGTEIDYKPVLYMRMPVPFTYKGLYNNILKAMDLPFRNSNVDSIKNQAFSMLKELRVELLIIDEMDYLLASTFVQRKAVMENIKDISNSANVCLVCVGTPAIEELRTLNTQHIRRYPKTVLKHFDQYDERFINFIKKIEEQLDAPPGMLDWSDSESAFPELLFNLTGGLVGWIKPILIEAFELIGVFDDGFNDFDKLKLLTGSILEQAQINIIGEFGDDDMDKILVDELKGEPDEETA